MANAHRREPSLPAQKTRGSDPLLIGRFTCHRDMRGARIMLKFDIGLDQLIKQALQVAHTRR